MNLLSPAALWTLAALALPLAIHLWRRPPRTVPWGSLRFLQPSGRRWQTLRWREYALLLTRLALLTALALILAHPFLRRPPFARPQRWALLDPAAAPVGSSLQRLRALQAVGSETRLLAPGFPRIGHPPADVGASAPDVWSLLREADATLPVGSSLAVFTPGKLASFRGIRPALANVRTEWIETPASPVSDQPGPSPSPHPLTISILHDPDRSEDARYVAAAWRAIAQADQRPVAVDIASTSRRDPLPAADWIFWLGDQLIPPAVTAHSANVLDDAAAPVDTPPGWIVSPLAPVRLWQRGMPTAGSVWWTDGFGQPLLTRTHDEHGTRWHFASRFHPAWNDLPLSAALPAGLRLLLLADAPVARRDDGRLADPTQYAPAEEPSADHLSIVHPGAEIDLRLALWLGAVFLFCVERLLSHRRAPHPAPVAAPPQPVLSR